MEIKKKGKPRHNIFNDESNVWLDRCYPTFLTIGEHKSYHRLAGVRADIR